MDYPIKIFFIYYFYGVTDIDSWCENIFSIMIFYPPEICKLEVYWFHRRVKFYLKGIFQSHLPGPGDSFNVNNFKNYIHFLSLSPLKIFQLELMIRAMADDLTWQRMCWTFWDNERRCGCRLGPWHCGLMLLHCGDVLLSTLTSLLISLLIRHEGDEWMPYKATASLSVFAKMLKPCLAVVNPSLWSHGSVQILLCLTFELLLEKTLNWLIFTLCHSLGVWFHVQCPFLSTLSVFEVHGIQRETVPLWTF